MTTPERQPASDSHIPEPDPRLPDYRRQTYAVWELTLKCNLACVHCGSRAGDARPDELTTEQALDLVRQLDEIGVLEISLIGGEAFLRKDWLVIAQEIADRGMLCSMTTGGYGISLETARKMRDAGIAYVSVSVDGLREEHDLQRGKEGSFEQCFLAMERFRQVGLPFGCNTQLNRLTVPHLPRLYELIHEAGAQSWQFQFTVPMGNAADNLWMIFQPAEILDVFPVLARVAQRANAERIAVLPGNNVGYFSPWERVIRHQHMRRGQYWMGCQAGLRGLGIEADGKIKGDPSLPSEPYTGGNIKDMPLVEILKTPPLTMNLHGGTPEGVAHLWGFCRDCDYADVCRGGSSWGAHVFFNRRGNYPYCHHRALTIARAGERERLAPKLAAIGVPFDCGVLEIYREPLDAAWEPSEDPHHFTLDKVEWTDSWEGWPFPEPATDVVQLTRHPARA